MKSIIRIGLVVLLTGFVINSSGQIRAIITNGKKVNYSIGDSVRMKIEITTSPKTCIDGMEQVKIFKSGVDIANQKVWTEQKKGIWIKELVIIITGNNKKYGMLTIMRRTDKESFSYQERFDFYK